MTLDEWTDCPEPEEDRTQRGRHASGGFPGKLEAAKNHAPPDTSFETVLEVAKEADERGVKVQVVWDERTQADLTGY